MGTIGYRFIPCSVPAHQQRLVELTNTSFPDTTPRFSAIIPPRRKFAPLWTTHRTLKKINHKLHEAAVSYAYPPCWRQPGSRRPPPTIPPPTTTTSATPPSRRRPTRASREPKPRARRLPLRRLVS